MVRHPHIYVTGEPVPGLRSVGELRRAIGAGRTRELWERVLQGAEEAAGSDPLVPSSPVPGRGPEHVAHANRDYVVCRAAGERILDGALAWLLTGNERWARAALDQIEALFDEARWPDWRDLAHPTFPADLRTGMLGRDIGIAYDWLYHWLSPAQRAAVMEGLCRRAFDPFWASAAAGAWWANGSNNWTTCIVGGLGMATMAVGEDYARSTELVDYSRERLLAYRGIYGPDGEFNESPAYAGSSVYPVGYFLARLYETAGRENLLAQSPFPEACRWYLYLTLPPGRLADFGDVHVGSAPATSFAAAVAHAARDPVLQGFCLAHDEATLRRSPAFDLLWFDEALAPATAEGRLPRGRAFPAHGGCIVSRSSWDPRAPASCVVSKAGHGAELHGNRDAGQVCIDGLGERLIVDLGMPEPVYPRDFFGPNRCRYYPASAAGHNVPVIGGREMRGAASDRARIVAAEFDDARGGAWTIDSTALYDGARRVRRTVVHLLPSVVVVLDRLELERAEEISLRWHTADRAEPGPDGSFTVRSGAASAVARIVRLDGAGAQAVRRGEHEYRPPFHLTRLGDPLRQKRESYVEVVACAGQCTWLTLFAVAAAGAEPAGWEAAGGGWTAGIAGRTARVSVEGGFLCVAWEGGEGWRVGVEPA